MRFYKDRMKNGFTLIEVMAASVILVMILMIASSVFHQGTIAWDSGSRKAQGGMSARAAMGLMASSMFGAVQDSSKTSIPHNGSSVQYVVLDMHSDSDALSAVSITRSGSEIKMDLPGPEPAFTLVKNVNSLKFTRSDNGSGGNGNLPEYVSIFLELERKDGVSGIGVYSLGPDGKDDNGDDDDIRTW